MSGTSMITEVPALFTNQHLSNTSPERKHYNIMIGQRCHDMTTRYCISNHEEERKTTSLR